MQGGKLFHKKQEKSKDFSSHSHDIMAEIKGGMKKMKQGFYINKRISEFSQVSVESVLKLFRSSEMGLSYEDVEENRRKYGSNHEIEYPDDSVFSRLKKSFINPFSIVLLILAVISFFTDILLPDNFKTSFPSVFIILAMLLISGFVRFMQELRSKNVADRLTGMIHTTIKVKREGIWQDLSSEDLVVGDLVRLYAGDRVPADMRIIKASDCFVSQSVITGESSMTEKRPCRLSECPERISEYINTLFMGTTLIGGNAEGVVLAVGEQTVYGKTSLPVQNSKHGFDRGANSIAWVLIKFMIVLVPVVFITTGITKGNWISAFIFSLSVAIGLTPELLPMVINACLAKGSYNMGEKDTIVKNINAMQGFGSIDVLCMDKTGTLTNDCLILEYYMDTFGNESSRVLDLAFLNSYYHSGIENPLDNSIKKQLEMPGHQYHFRELASRYKKTDEIPFDYGRRASSVLVENKNEKMIIMKGDVFTVLKQCRFVQIGNEIREIDENAEESVHLVVDEMMEDGMKVLAVASKKCESSTITPEEEGCLILQGYIAFFDAPKKSAASAMKKLKNLNVKGKVLSGDSVKVTTSICRRIGMDSKKVLTGAELDSLSDDDIQIVVEETEIFAELTPKQKTQIIDILQENGHSVGFLGDGMNDLPAMLKAEVGISVDTAAEAVKEAADVILLKKDLNVLEEGILEGRKAFVNMSKYIRITASSNFGNILAIVIAGVLLPFFPMTSIQLLLLNLLYDILCLILPWDNVDEDLYRSPLEWSGRNLSRFMLYFGPASSVFDILTFCFLLFVFCPGLCGGSFGSLNAIGQAEFVSVFQTGWFLESMWTQVLILHLLRTRHLPFVQSRSSSPVQIVTLAGILIFTLLAMTPAGSIIGMTPLPASYFLFLLIVVTGYLLLVTCVKKIYIKRFHELI